MTETRRTGRRTGDGRDASKKTKTPQWCGEKWIKWIPNEYQNESIELRWFHENQQHHKHHWSQTLWCLQNGSTNLTIQRSEKNCVGFYRKWKGTKNKTRPKHLIQNIISSGPSIQITTAPRLCPLLRFCLPTACDVYPKMLGDFNQRVKNFHFKIRESFSMKNLHSEWFLKFCCPGSLGWLRCPGPGIQPLEG